VDAPPRLCPLVANDFRFSAVVIVAGDVVNRRRTLRFPSVCVFNNSIVSITSRSLRPARSSQSSSSVPLGTEHQSNHLHSSSSHVPLALSSSTAAPPIVRRPSPFLDPAVAAANNPAVAALIRRSVVVTFGVVVSSPDVRIVMARVCRCPRRLLARSIDPVDRRECKNLYRRRRRRRRRFLSGTSSTASSTEDVTSNDHGERLSLSVLFSLGGENFLWENVSSFRPVHARGKK
jgi:hypothetical protein